MLLKEELLFKWMCLHMAPEAEAPANLRMELSSIL